MKIGIYISGLGQSFAHESVEKYTERLMNEMSYSTTGVEYELKTEKISYTKDRNSTAVSICEKKDGGKTVYKIYDFKYHEILTEKFNTYPLLVKNFLLLILVIKKIPLIIKRLFSPDNYNRPVLTLYIFMMFFIIACAVLLMLPATLNIITDFMNNDSFKEALAIIKKTIGSSDIPYMSKDGITSISETIVTLTALLLLILPNANVLLTNLATEFGCANDYIEYGIQKQLLQGNLELLVDYISEKEQGCKVHFHTYSFGTIVAFDYVFPFGNKVTTNAEKFSEAIITIGTPFEFIKSYYPRFYKNRNSELGNKLCWINIYSIADALATNFRRDAQIGEAEFGIDQSSIKPINLNYEVASLNKWGLVDFFMLHGIKAHGMYWDSKTEGQSCLRLIHDRMKAENLF